MTLMDEEIAKLLRKAKTREKLQVEEQNYEEEKEQLDEAEIGIQMEQGECTVFDRQFIFTEKIILNHRIKVYIPDKNLYIKANVADAFIAGENSYNVGMNFILAEDDTPILSWEEYQKKMKSGMDKINIRFKWIEEGCLLNQEVKLRYLEFLTMTGLGTFHNHMYMADTKYGRLTINLNYDDKNSKYWTPLIHVMMNKMEVI